MHVREERDDPAGRACAAATVPLGWQARNAHMPDSRRHTRATTAPCPRQDVDIRNLILYYGVGWKHTLEEVHDKDAAVREKEFNTTAYIPPDVDALLEAQSLDVELYDFSQVPRGVGWPGVCGAKVGGLGPCRLAATSCAATHGRTRDRLL